MDLKMKLLRRKQARRTRTHTRLSYKKITLVGQI